jgi:hypothetical protein
MGNPRRAKYQRDKKIFHEMEVGMARKLIKD